MFHRPFIFAVLLLFVSDSAFAWGWKDAVSQAVDRNPTLLSQQEAAQVFRLRYENAKTYRYPTFTLVGQYTEYQDYTENFRYRAYLGPEVQWLLYQGGKVTSGIHMASALNTQADMNTRVLSITTISKLRLAYASALYAKNFLELAHRIEDQRMENVKFTKIRYESGLEYKWVYLTSNAKWKQASLNTLEAEMNKKTALVDLENLLGPLPIQTVEELSDQDFYVSESDYDLNRITEQLQTNPKYLLQQSKVEESKAAVDFSRADRYPQLGLQADLWGMSTETNDFFPAWYAGVRLSMPLFAFNRYRRNVDAANRTLNQRTFDLEQTRLNLKNELEKAYQTYVIAKQQVDVSKLNVEATEDRAKVVSHQYRSGLTTFLDWENSQDGWVNAEVEHLNNIRDYQTARAKFEEAMGTELSKP